MNPLRIEDVSTCRKCPLLGTNHVPAFGDPNAEVMIVGQSPGNREVEELTPFVGPSGELLDLMLAEADLSREEVYITNALKCHPPSNRPGSPVELMNCRKTWLTHEIQQVKPKLIVLLGKDAWTSVGPPNVKFAHLLKIENVKKGFKVLGVYHPSYFLRRGDIAGFIEVGATIKKEISTDE